VSDLRAAAAKRRAASSSFTGYRGGAVAGELFPSARSHTQTQRLHTDNEDPDPNNTPVNH